MPGRPSSACGHHPVLGLTVGPAQPVLPPRICARLDQGRTPCSSVTPYDSATSAATSQRPVNSKTLASAASAATARPTNSGVSRLVSFSKYWMLASTPSVSTSPGYNEIDVILNG